MATPTADAAGIYPSQYLLNQRFILPSSSDTGGKNAIAISRSNETAIVALYAILVTGIFMGLWVLIAMAIPQLAPRKLRAHPAIRFVAAWDMTEPFQAVLVMARFCWSIICGGLHRDRQRRTSRRHSGSAITQGMRRQHWRRLRTQSASPPAIGHGTREMDQVAEKTKLKPYILSMSQSNDDVPSEPDQQPNAPVISSFVLGLAVFLLALATTAGSIIAGIFLPQNFVISSHAPANPATVFYPRIYLDPTTALSETGNMSADWHEILKGLVSELQVDVTDSAKARYRDQYYLQVAGAQRAAASIDSGIGKRIADEGRVEVAVVPGEPGPSEETSYELKYNFSVAGHQMGLQHAGGLRVELSGVCKFEYTWPTFHEAGSVSSIFGARDMQQVTLWPGSPAEKVMSFPSRTNGSADPWAVFEVATSAITPNSTNTTLQWTESSFAIIPVTLGISALSASRDPFYMTETVADGPQIDWDNLLGIVDDVKSGVMSTRFEVTPNRPPLACVEAQKWSYASSSSLWTGNLTDIRDNLVPGLNLPPAVRSVLFSHFSGPAVVSTGRKLGKSALESAGRVYFSLGLDAGSSSAAIDLERLVKATYIASLELFRGTVLDYTIWSTIAGANKTENMLWSRDNEEPVAGAGDFVLYSSQVSTLRFEALVAIPATLVAVWIVVLVLWLLNGDGKRARAFLLYDPAEEVRFTRGVDEKGRSRIYFDD
ncbi:hypothetical protein BDZ91DRAFT_736733 [Kalaharituber pfeilii]|nr:hypothetical protein BDZ91DRAFT_736733 [Kalaharituber pfeilii]